MTANSDTNAHLRWSLYWLLIAIAAAGQVGRIFRVQSADGGTPFSSANDRSRWSMIRALGDAGEFHIDSVIVKDPHAEKRWERFDHTWYSIDMVRHKGQDGREHYYSSKPPLTPVLLAGLYWLMKTASGATLTEHPFYVGRMILILANVLPFVLYLYVLARIVERYGRTDAGRVFTLAAAAFGTLLTPMAVSLNNHLHAAVSVLLAAAAVLAILRGERGWRYFAAAGFFSALAFANELPALALFALVAAGLLIRSPLRTFLAFAPAALIVMAGIAVSNHLVHGSWRPPYAHRDDGEIVVTVLDLAPADLDAGKAPSAVRRLLSDAGRPISAEAELTPRSPLTENGHSTPRWMLWDEAAQERFSLVGRGGHVEIREWDNWYEYEGTYWTADNLRGVDRGEASRAVYAFHLLLGHHGVFSLTPLWLLTLLGMAVAVIEPGRKLRLAALATLLVSVVCIAFYILRPEIDRNYGGVSCGARWLFWLIPLWLICLLPAADKLLTSRLGRGIALTLLAASVTSAAYNALNPWSHPWIFDYWTYLGWIHYP